jgi:transcriptional regulator with GAF, ATPase, and Fis domain
MADVDLPPLDLTRDLKDLAGLAGRGETVEDLLRRGLDWLGRVTPFDLATVFDLQGSRLVVRMAKGRLADDRVRHHSLTLDAFPSIREALETRRARAFTEADHKHGDGDPFDGVLDLPPGHSCMVVPLCSADRVYGVLALDREVCEAYPPQAVDLVEVYAQLLALALANAEQRDMLERFRHQDREQVKLLETELAGSAAGVFESSRAPAMRDIARRARQVAQTDTPVLLRGETGTGKERLARELHAWSRRADGPFVKINCAAIPAGLLESELFGHVKGAFTGATRDRSGRFQTANGGTLLLDEIGELPLDLQAKLLRVLQEGTLEPVGSDRTVKVDVRLLAATHVDLELAIKRRTFREDLYYRLNVFPLFLPPLRERLEDLPSLCEALLADQAQRTGRTGYRVSAEGMARLRAHTWPGNIRELANVLERATIISLRAVLGPDVLDVAGPPAVAALRPRPEGAIPTLDEVQAAHIRDVLSATGGRIYGRGGAAELLGLKPSTLQSRMQKLGIPRVAPNVLTGTG